MEQEITAPPEPKPSFLVRLKTLIRGHKGWSMAVGGLVVATSVIGVTDLKYPVLGLAVKSKVELTVIDSEINEPIEEATVTIAGRSGTTDQDGKVTLTSVSPGNQQIAVTKKAYQTFSETKKLGFGTNQIGTVKLQITGVRLNFNVTNGISGEPIDDAKVDINQTEGSTDAKGKATVSVETEGRQEATAKISKTGFVTGKLTVKLVRGQKELDVSLTPTGKVYFLSNSNRRIDLMRSNLDGSARETILAGTGEEDSLTGILPNIENPSLLALVSSRAGNRDGYGNLKHDLYVINGDTRKLTKVHSDIGFGNYRAWAGNYLIYEYLSYGETGSSSISSYNVSTGKSIVIATHANVDFDVVVNLNLVNGTKAYFSLDTDDSKEGFYVINADGTNKRRISTTPADNVYRQAKNTLIYQYYGSASQWRSVNLSTDKVTTLVHGPSDNYDRGYADSADNKYTAFVEERDGSSELYLANSDGSNEHRLTKGAKVGQFVQWYGSSYIVYSVTDGESALYVVGLAGGKPVKISDFFRGNGRTYGGGYNPSY